MIILNAFKPQLSKVFEDVKQALVGKSFQPSLHPTNKKIVIADEIDINSPKCTIEIKDDETVDITGVPYPDFLTDIIEPIIIPAFLDYDYQKIKEAIEKQIKDDQTNSLGDVDRYILTGFKYVNGYYLVFITLDKPVGNTSVVEFRIRISIDSQKNVKLSPIFLIDYGTVIQAKVVTYVLRLEAIMNH